MISLRHKLWLGYGALLLILLAVSLLTAIVLTSYTHELERSFHENYDSAIYCNRMNEAIDRLNSRDQFLLWQDARAKEIDPAAEWSIFQSNLELQLDNCELPGEAEHTKTVADLWQRYKVAAARFDGPYSSKAAPNVDSSLLASDYYATTLLPLIQQIHETAQWVADLNMSNMISVNVQDKRTLANVRNALLALVLVGVFAAALAVGAAGRSVLRPLKNLTYSAKQIEAGNLDLSLPTHPRDEIGQLAVAFNSMALKLREFRRLDQERLTRAQLTSQLAIDSLPDAVFIISASGVIDIVNRTARDHFGIVPGAVVQSLGRKLPWLLPLYEGVVRDQKAVESQGYGSAVQLFDAGEERFLLPRAVPMVGSQGSMIGVCVILVDITRLRRADEAKSSVVSTVSHELRTPLTAVRMALGLLPSEKFGPLSPKQQALLSAAREDSDRLYRVIENLMSISRMESGRAQYQFQPMAPRDIVAQAVGPLRGAMAEKALQLEVQVEPTLPQVMADPQAVGSVLTNLLGNALKFSPQGGRLCVSAQVEGDSVAFKVSDNGPGIPEEYSQRIFERFFRVPSGHGPSGAGLGLAIAKEVVEAHGGTIQLCRSNGAGSTFRFTLRRYQPASKPAARQAG
jgi:signal transduction histidine kinase